MAELFGHCVLKVIVYGCNVINSFGMFTLQSAAKLSLAQRYTVNNTGIRPAMGEE